jgi:hypothetical protein
LARDPRTGCAGLRSILVDDARDCTRASTGADDGSRGQRRDLTRDDVERITTAG